MQHTLLKRLGARGKSTLKKKGWLDEETNEQQCVIYGKESGNENAEKKCFPL